MFQQGSEKPGVSACACPSPPRCPFPPELSTREGDSFGGGAEATRKRGAELRDEGVRLLKTTAQEQGEGRKRQGVCRSQP